MLHFLEHSMCNVYIIAFLLVNKWTKSTEDSKNQLIYAVMFVSVPKNTGSQYNVYRNTLCAHTRRRHTWDRRETDWMYLYTRDHWPHESVYVCQMTNTTETSFYKNLNSNVFNKSLAYTGTRTEQVKQIHSVFLRYPSRTSIVKINLF